MTHDQMPPDRDSCSGDVAAYALGALQAAEAAAFERHLETCAVCPVELASFQQVVDDLAISPARHPAPTELRRRVMRAVAEEPRLHPEARRERRRSRLRLALPRPTLAFSTGVGAVAAAAAVVVLVLSSGSSTRTFDTKVTGRGSASLKVSGNHAQLVVRDFPAPPHGEIYEVWLQHGNQAPSPTKALFGVTGSGDGDVDVPGSLKGVSHVLVTPEPAGGSKIPTHPVVISATLTR
jgi:anti-sigma-K factor RskA